MAKNGLFYASVLRKRVREIRYSSFMNRQLSITVILAWILWSLGSGCQQKPSDGERQGQSGSGGNQAMSADSAVIDSLKTLVNNLKPGLGECMIQLKYHHDRLGEAITARDYERAAYEVDEMKETTEKIIQLNITNDKLQKPFALFYEKYLQSPLGTLADAAAKKDGATLHVNFISLTGNCNSCHHENNMSFMKIDP
jgi:hypothetical protein